LESVALLLQQDRSRTKVAGRLLILML
jgi:hypothetical protein